jgi:hypothetical protein
MGNSFAAVREGEAKSRSFDCAASGRFAQDDKPENDKAKNKFENDALRFYTSALYM